MHQSGTHWLKFMLANALSFQYGAPPPEYNHANDIIGGPRDPPPPAGLPRLISSHSVPHPLLGCRTVHGLLGLPPYVLLVRDLRASLASNYAKWRARYGTTFAEYLRGDPFGRRYNSDIWWTVRFLEGWGAVRAAAPTRVTVVRYEDLLADPLAGLGRVAAALASGLGNEALAHGVAVSGREAMRARDDPARPPGAVRVADDQTAVFDQSDRAFVEAVCRRYLRHDFGYDYTNWDRFGA